MIKNRHPGNYDPVIINRVKQYLEDNIHQTYVDVTIMAKELQQKYLEYNRRKAIPFRIMVEQAYKTVLHSYGLDSNSSTDDGGNSDLEVMGTEQTNANHMNDALTSMYMNKNKSVAPTNEGELIDISSDDSDDERQNQAVVSAFDKALAATKNDNNNVPNSNHNNTDVNKSTNTEKTSVIKSATDEEILNLKVDSRKKAFDVSGSTQVANKRRKVDGGDAGNIAKLAVQKNKKYKKEVFAKYVNVNFDNVGGMDKILKELCELLLHVRHPEIYRHIGLPPPRGFLLHGPPGCGKTLLAHAIAGQLDVPIIDITATEFVAGVSGESEERIREVFEQAAALAPVVLFIDEVDAISANRINAQKDMERRIVAQLLSSLDNLSEMEKGDQVLVIGATNRSDSIDPALRRVGRFDQEISLGIPDRDARCQILKIILRDLKLERPFDYEYLAQLTPGYVGADLLALATRAATTAIKRIFSIKEDNELTRKLCTFTKPADVSIVNLTDDSSFPLMDIDSTENDEVATAEQPKASNDATPAIAENGDATENMSVTDVGESEAKDSNNEKDAADAVNVDAESQGETPAKPEAEEAKDKTTAEKESEESAGTEDETAKGTETPAEMEQTETVADVVLSKPQLKLQLSLDNMLIWLTGDSPILTESELSQLSINKEDFVEAIKYVQPSAKREGFITVPDVTWDDIGSLRDIREELELAILAPVKFPGKLKTLGIQSPTGILLCGPPGCGKTLLAKAVANEAGINFISVKGPELLNMYVGESERAVRQCFQRARNSAPCVIFFDEFDSLCPRRSDSSENGAGMRVVNQLLTEMDGVEGRNGVFLMAATNRPDIIDPAVLRPGRFDKTLYVGLPEQSDRTDILQALTKNGTTPPLDSDVDLSEIAFLTGGYTGADLAGLVRQASLQSLKDSIRDSKEDNSTSILSVSKDHFLRAIQNVKPSVNAEDRKIYEILKKKYAVTESTGGAGN